MRNQIKSIDLLFNRYAPESLSQGKFSSRSDVWSFGVTMFEIFSFGEDPKLPGVDMNNKETESSEQFLEALTRGVRLPCPICCPQKVYVNIMYPCWNFSSHERPNFKELCDKLQTQMDEIQWSRNTSYFFVLSNPKTVYLDWIIIYTAVLYTFFKANQSLSSRLYQLQNIIYAIWTKVTRKVRDQCNKIRLIGWLYESWYISWAHTRECSLEKRGVNADTRKSIKYLWYRIYIVYELSRRFISRLLTNFY